MQAIASQPSSWRAELQLGYAYRDRRTVLNQRRHCGPLRVQRPFYPEAGVCHTYLLHPPGGVVGGDQLSIQVEVGKRAHALITTPASGKFYRSTGALATQQQDLQVADHAVLEWLPQDMILFNGCEVKTRTAVQLSGSGRFAGWEIVCQGRPASNEPFIQGQCRQLLELYRDGKPLLIERTNLQGGGSLQQAQWGLGSYPVTGTMLISGANADLLQLARGAQSARETRFSVTLIGDVLVCRYLGEQGIEAREQFARVWAQVRPAWIGLAPCMPRIWNT